MAGRCSAAAAIRLPDQDLNLPLKLLPNLPLNLPPLDEPALQARLVAGAEAPPMPKVVDQVAVARL